MALNPVSEFAGNVIRREAMFVQQYVKHDGHCAILPNEIAAGFSELREWKDKGVKPHAGLHPEVASGQSKGTDR